MPGANLLPPLQENTILFVKLFHNPLGKGENTQWQVSVN